MAEISVSTPADFLLQTEGADSKKNGEPELTVALV